MLDDFYVDYLKGLPPIPPKPLQNCEPSCDLSVIISSVAPDDL